jgi:hypothetical protein
MEENVVVDNKETSVRKIIKLVDPGTCTNGDRFFGVQVFVLLFLYFFNAVGGERLYGFFVTSDTFDDIVDVVGNSDIYLKVVSVALSIDGAKTARNGLTICGTRNDPIPNPKCSI